MFFLCTSETHGLALHFLAQALEAAVTNQAASHKPVYPTENWSPCLDKPLAATARLHMVYKFAHLKWVYSLLDNPA